MAASDDKLREVLGESHRRGFLGPGPITPHLTSAQGFAQGLPTSCIKRELRLIDMGSGGGLPGLPLFWWRTDLVGVLVDARSKRTRFLAEAVEELGLAQRVQVVTGRIEETLDILAGRFDIATARSFGPPSATLELASHLLNDGGRVLVSEPPGGRLWSAQGLAYAGLRQLSAEGASVASFERVDEPKPLRRWKHLIERPSIDVSVIGDEISPTPPLA